MMDRQILQNLAQKNQTTFRNVLREYLQHLFLSSFYKHSPSEHFLFKGGTALRLIFGSPRFSEDLDFSAVKNSVDFEDLLENVIYDIAQENIKVDIMESKPTSGGHLAILQIESLGEKFELYQEVSFRSKKDLTGEISMVHSNTVPSYNVYILDKKLLVGEKIQALLTRQKPRDVFDLYFILRKEELHQVTRIDDTKRKAVFSLLEHLPKEKISVELKDLLPKSFWPVIKDLPKVLKSELERR